MTLFASQEWLWHWWTQKGVRCCQDIIQRQLLLDFTFFFESESIRSLSSITEFTTTNVSLNPNLIIFLWYNVKLSSCPKVSTLDKNYLRNCPSICVIDLSVNSFLWWDRNSMSGHSGTWNFIISFIYLMITIQFEVAENADVILAEKYWH